MPERGSGGRTRRRAPLAIAMLLALLASDPRAAVAQMPGMPAMPSGARMMRWDPTLFVMFDELEYAPGGRGRPINFDARAWYGGSHNRLWLRGQGELATVRADAEGELEVLYGKLVDPFWDAVIGLHFDERWNAGLPSRALLTFGFLGLAPYRFELQPTLYVSDRGEIFGRFEAGFPLLLTQRLIAEPKIELNAALQDVPKYSLPRGLNDYEMGIRVRYEFRREFAPYVGWSRSRRYSTQAARTRGAESRFVAGVRLWR